jgi:FdhD protein
LAAAHAAHEDRKIHRFGDGTWTCATDHIAVEEPLEIRISHGPAGLRREEPLAITMRTPGQDAELAAGFLFGEGVVSARQDIAEIDRGHPAEPGPGAGNTVVVSLREGVDVDLDRQKRNFTATSACGVCGKASLDSLVLDGCRPIRSAARISAATVIAMPGTLRQAQRGFDVTGGVHAAGLFQTTGELISHAEDVGRHNAFDKLVGEQFLSGGMDGLGDMAVLLSGRASYELLQKALRARIPIVASVGAPSSLAVQIAETFGITLIGFLRPGGFNVYANRGRVDG